MLREELMEEGSTYHSDICHNPLPTILFHRQDTFLPFTISHVVEKILVSAQDLLS